MSTGLETTKMIASFFSPARLERIEDLLEERDVAVDQIEPALIGLAPQAGGDARSGRHRQHLS